MEESNDNPPSRLISMKNIFAFLIKTGFTPSISSEIVNITSPGVSDEINPETSINSFKGTTATFADVGRVAWGSPLIRTTQVVMEGCTPITPTVT